MAKPTRIKHSAAGIYFNDVQIDRGTSFGCSAALNTEELKEIGNIGIVEIIDGIPTVDITVDANEYGSIKTAAALANKAFDYGWVQAAPHAVSGQYVQSCSGNYIIDERLYTVAASGMSFVTEIAALTAGQSQVGVLSISEAGVLSKNMGTAVATGLTPVAPLDSALTGALKLAEVYLYSGQTTIKEDYILNLHKQITVTLPNFEYAKVDVVVPVKEVGDNLTTDTITRTMYVENAFCNRLDMTFSTGGVSTNSFGMESDNKRWFLGTKKTFVVDRLARTTGAYTLTQTPIQLDNGYFTLRCRYYNPTLDTYTVLKEGTTTEVAAGSADYSVSGTTATITAASNPVAGCMVSFRYCAAPTSSQSFLRLPLLEEPHPDPPGGLNQGQIEIYLTDDANNHLLRVESCTVSAALTREALNEIGHQLPYDRPLTLPVPVTVTINTTASDLQEFARLMNRGTEFAAGTLNELNINDFYKDLGLRIKMYREPDTKRAEVPFKWQPTLKELDVDDLVVTDEGFDLRLDTNATQTFSLKSDNLTIRGRV